MRRMIMIVLLFGLAASQAVANPLPAYDIQYIKAYPPQIRLNSNGFLTNLSGVMIFTRSSTAVIDSGVYIYEMPLTLDSTNTSGFTLDTEADSIMVDLPGAAPAKWGTLNHDTPPIKGYGIYKAGYSPTGIPGMGGWYLLLFDFAVAKMGFTQIIINEINAHNNWQNGCNFIELCNKDQVNHDISNWMIVCDTIYRIPTGTIIPSHGYFVLDESNFPALFDLDFGSDNIYLINADSQLVDEVGWSSDHGLNISFIRYPDGDADSTYNMIDFIGYNDNTSTSFENG
ncbi:MAG TPA: hypothetical protein DCZ43_04915, partial [candidate division Zixibacteria bacterium]|nr:hypothetical protein [candidate division Zixibacteria bacterium]